MAARSGADEKIDLITLLSHSLKTASLPRISAKKYYGIWGDDGMTDEEFIDEIHSLRTFNRNIQLENWVRR